MSRPPGTQVWVTALVRLSIAVVVAFIAVCVLWRAQGGQWQRVESASMGTRAPVGSLLWVEPVETETLAAGDFVTVRPPGSASTYSHLVLHRYDDGTITTQGVLPGPDPWRLSPDDVVGQVSATWWGVGWLVAAAPLLLVGGLLVAGAHHRLRRHRPWQLPATLVLGALVVSIAITVHQPFLGAEQIAFTPDDAGGADATYVGTGLLPVRLEVPDGPYVVLGAGEVGSVHVGPDDPAEADGRLTVQLRPDVPLWWWASLVLACFVPALGASASGLRGRVRRRRGSRGPGSAAGSRRRPRAACP